MKAWDYLQKTSGLPLSTEVMKQTYKVMLDRENIFVGKYRKLPVFAGYHIFVPASLIQRHMDDVIFRFHETKKDAPVMAATNLFGNIVNIHPFKDGNGRICRFI